MAGDEPTPAEVKVTVPLTDVDVDWFLGDLARRAQPAGGDVEEGGEERGGLMSFFVAGLPTASVETFVREMFEGEDLEVTVSPSDQTVEVRSTVPVAVRWFHALGPVEGPYERRVRSVCQAISRDPVWSTWWAQTPYDRLLFQSSLATHPWMYDDGDGEDSDLLVHARFDNLDILGREASEEEVNTAATGNVRAVLVHVAGWLGVDLPG